MKCQPVAINSGFVWPKNQALSSNKTISISKYAKLYDLIENISEIFECVIMISHYF